MNTYTPDRWVVVLVSTPKHGTIEKILATWNGNFTHGDSWKLSSENMEWIDKGEYWEVPQISGSVYHLRKQAQGMSVYMSSVYEQLKYSIPVDSGIEIKLTKPRQKRKINNTAAEKDDTNG